MLELGHRDEIAIKIINAVLSRLSSPEIAPRER